MQPVCGSTAYAVTALLFGLASLCDASTGSRFRGGAGGSGNQGQGLRVEMREVKFSLQSSTQELLHGGEGSSASRIAGIEASIWQTFLALPKNSAGRLAPRAVRYLVHCYFAKEHGWLIKGLEPHGMQTSMSEVHEVSILQDRAPALVEALLEARQSDRGLALFDVVAMIAALERLILDDSIKLLEAAYSLNYLSAAGPVVEEELHDILTSYLLIFQMGMRVNLSDARKHQTMKRKFASRSPTWQAIVEYEEDAVQNFAFAHRYQLNPFTAPHYTFETASHIVEDLAQAYGKFQNVECREMKEELIKLDINRDGRVPLSAFYEQPDTATYQFTESLDFLRTTGALDETISSNPQVRIANYMLGPSNCVASFSYYSVCCLSDCDALMNELEGNVQAPTAPAARLLEIVANLTSSSYAPEAPRQLSEDLQTKMHAIGERHGGEVPLHGRLFAQWLHSAFPLECPYPHVHESAAVLSPGHWKSAREIAAPKEERQRYIEQAANVSSELLERPHALEWSEDEVLPLQEVPSQSHSALGGAVRLAAQLATLLAVLRAVCSGLCAVASVSGKDREKEGQMLPLHM